MNATNLSEPLNAGMPSDVEPDYEVPPGDPVIGGEPVLGPLEPEPETPGGRTIVITFKGDRKAEVDLPPDARCTFGPLTGGPSTNARGFDRPEPRSLYLRVYSGANKEHQLAVFGDVVGFRDKALTMRTRVKVVNADSHSRADERGNTAHRANVDVAETWEQEV